jgi:hypothetical protein
VTGTYILRRPLGGSDPGLPGSSRRTPFPRRAPPAVFFARRNASLSFIAREKPSRTAGTSGKIRKSTYQPNPLKAWKQALRGFSSRAKKPSLTKRPEPTISGNPGVRAGESNSGDERTERGDGTERSERAAGAVGGRDRSHPWAAFRTSGRPDGRPGGAGGFPRHPGPHAKSPPGVHSGGDVSPHKTMGIGR